jgi:hypothetical protein
LQIVSSSLVPCPAPPMPLSIMNSASSREPVAVARWTFTSVTMLSWTEFI